MEETHGYRVLAAIVFTDVVGFSKAAGLNEPRALELLQRDFALMRKACEKHGGQVMNVMGDGLLLMFSSAVDAMECALEIQRNFYQASRTLPSDRVLHHRIGVHLGDVVYEHDNVFGDGVNVAARLQSEARPDAICFSRTVYDVVKNKVKMEAVYLGPRVLKNIPERVMVWQVPGPGEPAQAASDNQYSDLKSEETGVGGAKGAVLVVVSVVLAVAAVVLIGSLRASHEKALKEHSTSSVLAGLSKLVKHPAPSATVPATTPVTTTPTNPTPKPAAPAPGIDPQLQQTLSGLRKTYDFAGLVTALKQAGFDRLPNGPATIDKYQSLADMRQWLDQAVAAIPQATPLHANVDLGSGEVPCTFYGGVSGLVVDTGGAPQIATLWSLPPISILNISTALSQLPQAPSMANSWNQQFAQEYAVHPG